MLKLVSVVFFLAPALASVCNQTEYCCPDAKHCLTPTNTSCLHICVKVGVPCVSPCAGVDEYCCPDALHCLTPTNPGVFCNATNPCKGDQVCCPLTKLCVDVKKPCTPAMIKAPPPVPEASVCNSTEYCCPDAKHCLTPTNTSCLNQECSDGLTCCPLTKLCVKVGNPCSSPCAGADEYCCPDALHCLAPTKPGVFCSSKSPCPTGQTCCPLTKICVAVKAPCTPP